MQDQLGHAVVSTTNTYLNAGKHQRQELLRKTDELRSRCNLVANEVPMEQSPSRGTETWKSPKSMLNRELLRCARVAQLDRATAS